MTLAQLNTAIQWPGYFPLTGSPTLGTDVTLDAAGEYQALIFCAREDMVISHIGFRTGAVSGSPTADVRIETVSATGFPSGTLWNTNTNIVTGALSANTTALHALTASASITKGQIFCIKIAYNSGTSFIIQRLTGFGAAASNLPYEVVNTGTPTRVRPNGNKIIAVGSSATAFYSLQSLVAATAATSQNFNNTNGARRGLRFKVPYKCRCVGAITFVSLATGDFNMALFDDAGAELNGSSTAFDGDHNMNGGTGGVSLFFDNPVTLSPDTWYRLAFEPSSVTNHTLYTLTLPSADYRSGTPGGLNHHYTTYASGSWTDSATDQVPMIDLLIDQLDDGASAGGLIRHPGMNGGLSA